MNRRTFLGLSLSLAAIGCINPDSSKKGNKLSIHLRDLADPSATNNTTVIQDAMTKAAAQGVPLFIDSGQWKHTGLTIPSGLTMIGAGRSSELYNTASSIALNATSASNFILKDFALRGTATVDNSLAYPTVSQTGTGIKCSASENFNVDGLYMTLIGTGIDYEANPDWGSKGRFSNIDMDFMYRAVWATASGEYGLFHSINVDKSTFGLWDDSGNNIYSNCQVVRSGVACKVNGGTNNGHGQFIGCTFNHNNYNLDVYDAVTLGMTFSGCHFIGDLAGGGTNAKLRIANSKGITITGGQIGSNITIMGGTSQGQNMIANNYFRSDIVSAPVYVSGGVCLMKNNYDAAGLVAWNN